jgi:outer membrane receptor protein involved in Fe transport
MAIIGGEYLREFATWEPRLNPEQSIGFNLGPEYFWRDKVRIHLNLFWNELWDALSFTSFDKESETYQKMVEIFPQGSAAGKITDPTESDYTKTVTNVDRARTYGAESYVSIGFNSWHGSFSYIYTMARDITNDVRLENKPTDIMKISLSRVLIFGSSFALTPGISYRYTHGELDGEDVQPDIYRLDAHISLSFGDRFTLTLGIDNITDQKDIQYLKQLPGRMIYVTNNLSF